MQLSREEIGQAILNVCAGQKTEDAFAAQADALATAIGGIMHASGRSCDEATGIVSELCADMTKHVRGNWAKIDRGDH